MDVVVSAGPVGEFGVRVQGRGEGRHAHALVRLARIERVIVSVLVPFPRRNGCQIHDPCGPADERSAPETGVRSKLPVFHFESGSCLISAEVACSVWMKTGVGFIGQDTYPLSAGSRVGSSKNS